MARRGKARTVLLTGFPGFLGRRLLEALAREGVGDRFVLLVQERMVEAAEASLASLGESIEGFAGRWELVVGDISQRRLGLEPEAYDALADRVTRVWHLAALYNLAVEEQLAYRVNVVGTVNVLDFCERAREFERLNYVSTSYVSGSRQGLIREVELDEGQGFKNHYESTKFWAEVEVQRRLDRLPAVIFRPGIVVGDSRTGETDKYDGPYTLMRFIMKMPDGAPMLNIGDGESLVNIVPVDYAIAAMVAIAGQEGAVGQVFHIADPNPMRARDLVSLILETMGKAPPMGRVPPLLVDALMRLKPLRELVDVPREAIVYFNHNARYDTANTQDALEDTPLRCPHISTYLDVLINYLERNPDRPRPV